MKTKATNKSLVVLAVFLMLSAGAWAFELPEYPTDGGIFIYAINAIKGHLHHIVHIFKDVAGPLLSPAPLAPKKSFLGFKPAGFQWLSPGEKVGTATKVGHGVFEIIEEGTTALYVIGMEHIVNIISADISENLVKYILMNPSPLQPNVKSAMYFFVLLLFPAYILAIVLLGIYIQFLSASPRGRSRAKSMLTNMVIGMVIISTAPNLLDVFLNISQGVTENILNQGKAEVEITTSIYTGVMRKTWDLSIAVIYGTGLLKMAVGPAAGWVGGRKIVPKALKGIAKGFNLKAEPSRTAPMLMTIISLSLGVYGILLFRYFMVMFFTLVFPFTIFFLSFEPTKKLGGTLLEQLLLWTLVQEFYALTLVAVGVGMMLLPDSLLKYGFGIVIKISFFEAAACVTVMMGPIILFMLLRKLLPPT